VINPSQRPLPTQHKKTQKTNIYVLGGIWTRDANNRGPAELRLRPHGHPNRLDLSPTFSQNTCQRQCTRVYPTTGLQIVSFRPPVSLHCLCVPRSSFIAVLYIALTYTSFLRLQFFTQPKTAIFWFMTPYRLVKENTFPRVNVQHGVNIAYLNLGYPVHHKQVICNTRDSRWHFGSQLIF
jgi:hypothetical protein